MLWQQGQNLFDVVDKAHVEHPVRFIKDQAFDFGEVDGLLSHVVQQAPRCRDDDIDPFSQCRDLGVDSHAAENDRGVEREIFSVGFDTVADLGSQFACRCQDKSTHVTFRSRRRVFAQTLKQRQGKAGCFTGPCLGSGEDITFAQDDRNCLLLDRGRAGVAFFFNRTKQFGR